MEVRLDGLGEQRVKERDVRVWFLKMTNEGLFFLFYFKNFSDEIIFVAINQFQRRIRVSSL